MDFFELFNTRELAIIIWTILLLGLAFLHTKTRQAILGLLSSLLKYLFVKVISISLALMGLYIFLIVLFLQEIGFWEPKLLKDTIIWAFFVAIVSLFRIGSVTEDKNHFKDALKDNLKVIILVEFIISFYTFSLWTELGIVFVATLLTLFLAVAEMGKENKILVKPLSNLTAFLGLGIFLYAGYKTVSDFETFATRETLVDFLLPIALSILFLPFLFLLLTYMVYENIFVRMHFQIKDEAIKKFAKRQAILKFRFNRHYLKRWIRRLSFSDTDSEADILKTFEEFWDQIEREKNPKKIPFSQGWSPHKAIYYLAEEGLKTGHYERSGGKYWYAHSQPWKLDDQVLANNITYYIEGNQDTARILKLKMMINYRDSQKDAHKKFLLLTEKLCEKSLGVKLPSQIQKMLKYGKNAELTLKGRQIKVTKEKWPSKVFGEYEITFIIEILGK